MNVLNQFISFLKEYKKLLERGVKDILNSNISKNFIWINEIESFINSKICESNLVNAFTNELKKQQVIFSLQKPIKPIIEITERFIDSIIFDEAKNNFDSINDDEDALLNFKNSIEGKIEIEKLNRFKKNKEAYSKFYRAYNDIKNDTNLEIVLSVGLIQYSKRTNNENLSKTNQHLFHFPLTLSIDSKNVIKISFSENENPYVDFFFLNNTPIEKDILTNIIETFEREVQSYGYDYFYEKGFKDLISNSLQKISSYSEFENSIYKPESDIYKEDYFKITFSPAINIKNRKPRFFERLMDSIIKYNNENDVEAELFNLLIRNPESTGANSYTKSNYFTDELYEQYKNKTKNLNRDDDFSVFFPLPFNKEQKQIYDNYLKNRLTVVTGPPGTGKSHTIVNILCSLLAQGKRVLVTAQTDKALESLLSKIPKTFDSLIFTKIELENLEEDGTKRFSFEKSIENISQILSNDIFHNVDLKIEELDKLKSEYLKLKSEIILAFEKEYSEVNINELFNNLRPFQIIEKFEVKDSKEWNWIKDSSIFKQKIDFKKLCEDILFYKENINSFKIDMFDSGDRFNSFIIKINQFDFIKYIYLKNQKNLILSHLNLNDYTKGKLISIDIEKTQAFFEKHENFNFISKKIIQLETVIVNLRKYNKSSKYTSNVSFSELVRNRLTLKTEIQTLLKYYSKGNPSILNKVFDSEYKKVSYIESFLINGKKCNNQKNILELQEYITKVNNLIDYFKYINSREINININPNYTFEENENILLNLTNRIELNINLLKEISENKDILILAEYFKENIYDIKTLYSKFKFIKFDLIKLKENQNELSVLETNLKDFDNFIIENSHCRELKSFFPLNDTVEKSNLDDLKVTLKKIKEKYDINDKLSSIKAELEKVLPLTLEELHMIPNHFITKENFEYASAYTYLKENEFIDLQKCKEELTFINNKIFQVKCEILFDLAKSNFKNKFQEEELNSFINLLRQYKITLEQANRNIINNTRFQILARQNSIAISKKLSCWVMKFNDVLNSVGEEPEIFDCVIVDEASQLDFNSLILGYYAKSIIIVGDDKQTSPSSLTGANNDDFESNKNKYLDYLGNNIVFIRSDLSLFSLAGMVAGTANLELKEHFRCVPELIEFSKREFYNNSLRPLKQINSNRLNPKETVFVKDSYTENKIVYKEIEEIKFFLRRILKEKQYENKTIGVVSLGLSNHTEKLKDIKEELSSEFGKDKIDKHKLIIEDSPKFQGDERDVMIVSLGVAIDFQALQTNQDSKPRAIINNQDDFKKINVALSRAKEQMILFHSVKSEHLKPNDFRNKILSFFNEEIKPISPLLLQNYNSQRFRHNVPEPFDSWFEYDIAKALIDCGYSYIQPQYKVKEDETYFNPKTGRNSRVHFKLDLVVHNNGKMIAIECDGDTFHSLPEDVAYDIERQEFLERVGWKIYRVLYSAFKRSPQEEIQKIINFIEENTKKDYRTNIENKIVVEDEFYDETKYSDQEESSDFDLNIENPEIDFFEENATISNPITQPINTKKINKHKSFIDMIEENLEETNKIKIETEKSEILCFFNLFFDNTYKIQEFPEEDCLYSLPIEEKYKNGFLLQCYDNGHINKVNVKTILEKKMDYHYSNGKNPNANIIYLKLIEEESIISIIIKKGQERIFKAHYTENISTRDLLQLLGIKIVYQDYDEISYKILPIGLKGDIERLIYSSFAAEGKSMNNSYYENEWKVLSLFLK